MTGVRIGPLPGRAVSFPQVNLRTCARFDGDLGDPTTHYSPTFESTTGRPTIVDG